MPEATQAGGLICCHPPPTHTVAIATRICTIQPQLYKPPEEGGGREGGGFLYNRPKSGKVKDWITSTGRRYLCTIAWSDFHLISENGHIAIDCLYFYELISKKSANFEARAEKFSFSKKSQRP